MPESSVDVGPIVMWVLVTVEEYAGGTDRFEFGMISVISSPLYFHSM